VLAAAGGRWYEQRAEAADARRFPPPGRFIDVGGRRLHTVCIGAGSPVVVFEPSAFGNSLSFSEARETLARRVRVCSYDRAGAGWSDPGPDPLSIGMLADDALRVLDGVSPGAPAVVVASSVGGFTAELLARRHPERVAALVLLDAGNSVLLADAERQIPLGRATAACLVAPAVARLGLIRLADPFHIEPSTSDARARSAALTYRPSVLDTVCAILHGFPQTRDEFARAAELRSDLPLVVLSAESERGLVPPVLDAPAVSDVQVLMQKAHRSLASRSSRGAWRIVPGSDHLIAGSQPQAVVDAIYDAIRR
jgi:pimeloyl-ACP methyl ester carboxylesterase